MHMLLLVLLLIGLVDDDYDLSMGTIGGLLYSESNDKMYLVTAGHCAVKISNQDNAIEQLKHVDDDDHMVSIGNAIIDLDNKDDLRPEVIKSFVLMNDILDCAFLPLKKLPQSLFHG